MEENINQLKRYLKNITYINKTKFQKWITENNLNVNDFNYLYTKK